MTSYECNPVELAVILAYYILALATIFSTTNYARYTIWTTIHYTIQRRLQALDFYRS